MTARALVFAALVAGAAIGLAVWTLRVLAPATDPGVALDRARIRPQGDLLVGALPEPSHLNPLLNVDAAVRSWVLRFTHDALCDLDPATGQVRPALAQAIAAGADGTLRIDLRRDARFADGTPVTAADVAFSHRCARASGLPASSMVRAARMVDELVAATPYELVARGLAVHWSARDVFTTGLLVVSRAAAVERVAARARARGLVEPAVDTAEFAAALAELPDVGPGSGPYMLAPMPGGGAPWQRGQHLDLVQNPHSWRRSAAPLAWNLAGLRHRFVRDPAAQLALACTQDLDWLTGDVRALAEDERLRDHYRLVVYDPITLGHFMVAWNCRVAPVADARVRQALAHLFDRDTIARQLLHGDAVPAATWFKPGMADAAVDLAPPVHDPAAGAALLRAAGLAGDGQPRLRVEILGGAEDPLHRRILELAQASFAAAGVELVAQLVEGGVLRERLQRREFQGVLLLKYHADPWIDPWPHFHSSQAGDGGQNWMGFSDGETDRLLDAARHSTDAPRRAALHREFCRRVHELQPVALLVHPRTALLLHRRFQDAAVGATGLSPELWWVPPDQQRHKTAAGAR